jgi:putative transposase
MNDAEWEIIKRLLPSVDYSRGGRPPDYSKRDILDAIFYQVRGGGAWRMLPHDFPPMDIVFHYFSRWKKDGTWQRIHDTLVVKVRKSVGKEAEPSAAMIDSQSTKTGDQRGERGYDAGKKVKGRKRHILVDTLGLILVCVVHTADIQDRDGAKLVLEELEGTRPKIEKIWADGGYAGKLEEWVAELREDDNEIELEIVRRSDDTKGFKVLPMRWIVERTFAWLSKYRRLSKDYEIYPETTQSMIFVVMIKTMLGRLT